MKKLLWILIAFVLVACRSGGDFEGGMQAFARGDYAGALQKWRPLAESGDAAAQTNVGFLYYEGKGVPQSYEEAIKWYTMAASKGYPDASFNLGVAYAEGKGVERNSAEALKWYRAAADAGYAPAQVMLGNIYFRGVEAPLDREAGFKWYMKAAEQDDVVAQFFVANSYEIGQGVPEDLVQAYKWLAIAEGGNHPDAKKTGQERKERIAAIMSKEQIADAEKQASEWIAKNRAVKR